MNTKNIVGRIVKPFDHQEQIFNYYQIQRP